MRVQTVDLIFQILLFCSIAIEGERPSLCSISGLVQILKNCLKYEERDSMYLYCPSL